jgi:hypothetical protein
MRYDYGPIRAVDFENQAMAGVAFVRAPGEDLSAGKNEEYPL